MKIKVVQFAQDPRNNQYDICFVIIMGHGNVSEVSHETIIYGVDGNTISANDIQKNLRMKNARAFEENPKYSSSKYAGNTYLIAI
ncbi:hypothetical protein NQ314_018619 [Rhamnusium bicolor]|uniref:Peptidase C14 caspase domain-containing protein n=1 Tax=Rhamnusium bicolor TaxID=1586634 RepID=A0AAV8WRG4_9CUCU|nr:hypothetical protein NQ314_018619 [Rhamnusium bicolor]